MSALDRLKDIPEMEIVEKLKISYDGLKTEEKELFLDIACFFRGWYRPMEILEACGHHLKIGIKVLRQKSLITIKNSSFDMHDLVQEMAHYIVRGEHPDNPEYHSRLWKREEIINMWLGDATKKNDAIKAIRLYGVHGDGLSRFCKNVSNMKKIRWLWVEHSSPHVDEGPNFLSNELRYINWDGYPGTSFPDNFQPMKLLALNLHGGLQKVLWKGYKDLPCLKVLKLEGMKTLVSTPNFKGLPCLQKLILDGCVELEEIHQSIGNHASLQSVSVSYCGKLKKFPTIVHMEKLQTLSISNCIEILEFPEIQENMECLVNLSFKSLSRIEILPSSIGELCTNLTSLDLSYLCNLKSIEFNMDALKRLKKFNSHSTPHIQLLLSNSEMRFNQCLPRSIHKLDLGNCHLEDGKFLGGIVNVSNLEELDLSENDFSRLDFSLLQLTRLKILNLRGCRRLVELPHLPSSVAILKADYCDSLKAVGDSLANCRCLRLVSLEDGGMINDGDRVLQSMLQGKAIENGTMLLRHKGGLEIAKGFWSRLHEGNNCRLQLPENWRNEFCGFLMCDVGYAFGNEKYLGVHITVEQVKKSGLMDSQHEVVWEERDGDRETWVGYISFASLKDTTPWWDQTYDLLSFRIDYCFPRVNGFGVRLVGKKGESGPSDYSQISNYTPKFWIPHVSESDLKIEFRRYP